MGAELADFISATESQSPEDEFKAATDEQSVGESIARHAAHGLESLGQFSFHTMAGVSRHTLGLGFSLMDWVGEQFGVEHGGENPFDITPEDVEFAFRHVTPAVDLMIRKGTPYSWTKADVDEISRKAETEMQVLREVFTEFREESTPAKMVHGGAVMTGEITGWVLGGPGKAAKVAGKALSPAFLSVLPRATSSRILKKVLTAGGYSAVGAGSLFAGEMVASRGDLQQSYNMGLIGALLGPLGKVGDDIIARYNGGFGMRAGVGAAEFGALAPMGSAAAWMDEHLGFGLIPDDWQVLGPMYEALDDGDTRRFWDLAEHYATSPMIAGAFLRGVMPSTYAEMLGRGKRGEVQVHEDSVPVEPIKGKLLPTPVDPQQRTWQQRGESEVLRGLVGDLQRMNWTGTVADAARKIGLFLSGKDGTLKLRLTEEMSERAGLPKKEHILSGEKAIAAAERLVAEFKQERMRQDIGPESQTASFSEPLKLVARELERAALLDGVPASEGPAFMTAMRVVERGQSENAQRARQFLEEVSQDLQQNPDLSATIARRLVDLASGLMTSVEHAVGDVRGTPPQGSTEAFEPTDGEALQSIRNIQEQLGSLGEGKKGSREERSLAQRFLDEAAPLYKEIKKVEKAAGKETPKPPAHKDPRVLEMNRRVGAQDMVNSQAENGVRNYDGTVSGLPGLIPAYKKLGVKQGHADVYIYARHAKAEFINQEKGLEFRSPGKVSRLDVENAIAKLSKDQEIVEFGEIYRRTQEALLQKAVDAGFVTEEVAWDYLERNPWYVPLERLMPEGMVQNVDAQLHGTRRRLSVDEFAKVRKGSELRVQHVMEQTLRRWMILEQSLLTHELANGLYDYVRHYEGMKTPDGLPLTSDIAVIDPGKAEGSGVIVEKSSAKSYQTVTFNRPSGKRVKMHIADSVADALQGIKPLWSAPGSNMLARLSMGAQRHFAVVANPNFATLNFLFRDGPLLAQTSRQGIKTPFANWIAAAKWLVNWAGTHGYKARDVYKMAKDVGALGGTRAQFLRHQSPEQTLRDASHQPLAMKFAEWLTLWKPLKLVSGVAAKYSSATENLSRLPEFDKALAKGLKEHGSLADALKVAKHDARDVIVNYARRGTATAALARHFLFLQSRIGGIHKWMKSAKEHPYQFVATGVGYMLAPMLANWLIVKDEEWYRNLHGWQKAANGLLFSFDEGENVWGIPVAFEAGASWMSLPRAMIDMWYQDADPKTKQDATDAVLAYVQQYFPLSSFFPDYIRPEGELLMNYSTFLGRQIETDRDRRQATTTKDGVTVEMDESLIKSPFNTQLSQWISEDVFKFASPKQIDFFLSSHTAGFGTRLVQMAEQAAGVSDVEFIWQQIPVLKRFVKTRYSSQGGVVSTVMDLYKEVQAAKPPKGTPLYEWKRLAAPVVKQWTEVWKTTSLEDRNAMIDPARELLDAYPQEDDYAPSGKRQEKDK